MAKNDVSVSNNFYKAVAKRAYMRESVKRKRQNKEFREKKNNAKHRKRSEREYEKQTFHKGKVSNREHIRELNRKAQKNLREAMQSSRLNQAEICQRQDSIRHSMSKVIQSFRDR